MDPAMRITDVQPSDGGYYATVDGREYRLTGWFDAAPKGLACDRCGSPEEWDGGNCTRALYGADTLVLCGRCLAGA